METLSSHSNESIWAMTIKNTIYVAANFMNIYAKFQSFSFIPLMASEKKISSRKFDLSVAMATNQNQRFGQNSNGW